MYNVLDICRFVINYSNEKDYGVSNLKLQKLLYFIQAYFLINSEEKCFNEKIEAWDFGPVVREAYLEYKQYGNCNIPSIDKYHKFHFSNGRFNMETIFYNKDDILQKDRTNIEKVVDMFSPYSATDLVTLTHNQAPWKNAYNNGRIREITIESLKEYFSE